MVFYYYNFFIENYVDSDLYVSEKLWDVLLFWCLLIYYGGLVVDKLLLFGSFLRLLSMDEKGLLYIKDVIFIFDVWYEVKYVIVEVR